MFPADVKGSPNHRDGALPGIKVLGSFVGEDSWCSRQLLVRVERALRNLPAMCALRDCGPQLNTAQQIRQMLVRYCANTTLVYFLRTMPPSVTAAAARRHDELIERAFYSLVHSEGATTTEITFALRQARLPVSLGGMGLTAMVDIGGFAGGGAGH